MKELVKRIGIWLGVAVFLTLVAMGIWYLACDGAQTTASLKWLQFLQTVGTFALPPILCAWFWSVDRRPFAWLKMNKGMAWLVALLAVAIMICAIPGINLLADLNGRIQLPKSLDFIEQILRQQEDAAALLTERFLQADNSFVLLINIGLMALLPALAEELTFRGTLQQIFTVCPHRSTIAIWLAAFIFSAIHMQFYGFIPRMLMGAMFGYVFVWTGSLWVPILMHFTNNAIAVLSYYILNHSVCEETWVDTIGSGNTWWLGVISIAVVVLLLWLLRLVVQKEK